MPTNNSATTEPHEPHTGSVTLARPDHSPVDDVAGPPHGIGQRSSAGVHSEPFPNAELNIVDDVSYSELAVMLAALSDGPLLRRRIDPVTANSTLVRKAPAALFVGLFSSGGTDDSESVLDRWDALAQRERAATD